MTVRSSESRFRRGFRILVAVALLLAVGGLYGALVGQLKSATDEDESFVALERHGVAYLRPLSRLVGELTAAQSAAVRDAASTRSRRCPTSTARTVPRYGPSNDGPTCAPPSTR